MNIIKIRDSPFFLITKIIGKSVNRMIKTFFYNGHMFKEINKTVIT